MASASLIASADEPANTSGFGCLAALRPFLRAGIVHLDECESLHVDPVHGPVVHEHRQGPDEGPARLDVAVDDHLPVVVLRVDGEADDFVDRAVLEVAVALAG